MPPDTSERWPAAGASVQDDARSDGTVITLAPTADDANEPGEILDASGLLDCGEQ